MGTIIAFPAQASQASRRRERAATEGPATVVILPAIRIERHDDVTDDSTPDKGAASKRRRRHGRVRS